MDSTREVLYELWVRRVRCLFSRFGSCETEAFFAVISMRPQKI